MQLVHIIITSSSEDVRELISDRAKDLQPVYSDSARITVDQIRYYKKIAVELDRTISHSAPERPHQILILDETCRYDESTPGEPELGGKVNDVRKLKETYGDLDIIFLVHTGDQNLLYLAQQLGSFVPFLTMPSRPGESLAHRSYDERVKSQLARLIEERLGTRALVEGPQEQRAATAVSRPVARLEFSFVSDRPRYAVFWLDHAADGTGYIDEREGPSGIFNCSAANARRFLSISNRINAAAVNDSEEIDHLLSELDKISNRILSDAVFQNRFRDLTSRISNKDRTFIKIKFITDDRRFPCAFEAIKEMPADRPWPTQYPTSRSVDFGLDEKKLEWHERDRVNILVVDGSTKARSQIKLHYGPGKRAISSVRLSPLTYVQQEVGLFERLKTAAESDAEFQPDPDDPKTKHPLKVGIGKVTILTADNTEGRLLQRIRQELTADLPPGERYDIFHFAGHTTEIKDNIQFVLPTKDRGAAVGLNLPTLASWLETSNIQFVYLSCCSSIPPQGGSSTANTSAAVAQVMARHQVPVTLGFRWDIQDDSAFDFASSFYTKLLCEDRNFDEAVRAARAEVYNDPPATNRVMWLAPVLLLQAREA